LLSAIKQDHLVRSHSHDCVLTWRARTQFAWIDFAPSSRNLPGGAWSSLLFMDSANFGGACACAATRT
jgi:hypothetical protein